MNTDKKGFALAHIISIILAVGLLLAAFVQTDLYNKEERTVELAGAEVLDLPDYSGLCVDLTKSEGGWSAEINGSTFDAYTLTPNISNPSGSEISDYKVRINVNSDVYFITAWCGCIEFHQNTASGNGKVQTIDLRNRPAEYLVDTVQSDDNPLIPLYAGDYFVYIPSSADGETPLADGASCAPGIMYYEQQGASDVFEFVPAEKPAKQAEDSLISAVLSPRSSTWTKVFDLNNEGNTEPDYRAYTYDLVITNNSDAVLSDYSFDFSFGCEAYLASAWNGSLEIRQGGKCDFIEDLRSLDTSALTVSTVNVDGEDFIALGEDDSFSYYPNTSVTAKEVPVDSGETSVPGFIAYLKIDEELTEPSITLSYRLHKSMVDNALCRAAIIMAAIAVLSGIILAIVNRQQKNFQIMHEHDSSIIRESIDTFIGFIDAKDPYTKGHSRRVADYTKLIAENAGYKGDALDNVYYIALLHDCGKIGVADSILSKPGKLTDEEFEHIKSHTTKGRDILANFKSIENVTEGAVYHHERYDGKGYPEGKSGTDIPEIARMICVADSFDAMNSDRCYRKKLSRETIISELEKNKGKQFDPKFADIMLRLIENGQVNAASSSTGK